MHKPIDVEIFDNPETNSSHIEWRCEDCEDDPNYPCDVLTSLGAGASSLASYAVGCLVKVTREPYELWTDDSPDTLAFWDGYYGRPFKLSNPQRS